MLSKQVSEVLEKIAKRKGTLIASVALAYVMHKAPYVFPICGGRKVDHLKGNIEALGLQLSAEDMEEIEQAYPFDVGFPHNMLSGGPNAVKGSEDNVISKRRGHIDYVKAPQPIPPTARAIGGYHNTSGRIRVRFLYTITSLHQSFSDEMYLLRWYLRPAFPLHSQSFDSFILQRSLRERHSSCPPSAKTSHHHWYRKSDQNNSLKKSIATMNPH